MGFDFVVRVVSKPLPVILFRLGQHLNLQIKFRTGYWKKLAGRLEQKYFGEKIFSSSTVLFESQKISLSGSQWAKLAGTVNDVLSSRFKIFYHDVPDLDICSFSNDWRYGKEWPKKYFKQYKFYEEKEIPYDVKFPWELSRLHYLVPVLALQAVGEKKYDVLERVLNILSRWRNENPLAYSVNWYPMEASMRVISLVMMLDLVKLIICQDEDSVEILTKLSQILKLMLTEHGVFVWANREFTDVRGNHFSANIVALLLASQALEMEGEVHPWWKKYALKWLDKEVKLQFYRDGVNFEKSCGYHKLVLELFMLAAIARKRFGKPFSQENTAILAQAACYSDAITRTDGLVANFGDIDNSTALPFDIDNPRNHGLVVELARAFFDKDIGSVAFKDTDQLAAVFLLGRVGPAPAKPAHYELLNFPHGGYVIVRCHDTGFFFMADVGEVGMSGRGGHGHNDILSFELCLSGRALIIDPGCSTYTGDLKKKALYRSTASHSTIQLFGKEVARFAGHWSILDEARPLEVGVSQEGDVVKVRAGHNGYDRVIQGTTVFRNYEVNALSQDLQIVDEIESPCSQISVRWAFPVGGVEIRRINKNEVNLGCDIATLLSQDVDFDITKAPYSEGYGHEIVGRVISSGAVAHNGRHCFRFRFQQAKINE